jgi:hypothetical protein
VTFEEYLISKKIDRALFAKSEPALYQEWQSEFEQIHPNSFTVQKLNLINPIRRKYQLKIEEKTPAPQPEITATPSIPMAAKPGKPIIKPKPKIN